MELSDILTSMIDNGASDAHLMPGLPLIVRAGGQLNPWRGSSAGRNKPESLDAATIEAIIASLPDAERVMADLQQHRHARVRQTARSGQTSSAMLINAYYSKGEPCLTLRLIPTKLPTLQELSLPVVVEKLMHTRRGLMIVASPIGGGKATTAYAMLNHINLNRFERIAICENPTSYEMGSKMSLVTQQSIGADIASHEDAIMLALQTDVDILMVDDLNTPRAASLALQMAENGRLVMALLPGRTVETALDTLLDRLEGDRDHASRRLARVIHAVIAQRLLPRMEGGRIAVHEIVFATSEIREAVAAGTTDLRFFMEASGKFGMTTMDQSIATAYRRGEISYETAATEVSDIGVLR